MTGAEKRFNCFGSYYKHALNTSDQTEESFTRQTL